ncbi:hypothetical protein ILUMI_13818 [Ignelater luminosus]|uniref:Uncharacterized protein n=1 Tax=Ignelater luminosus TaxID=2038154 RepID=A0A8K0CW00_IGNLU|nr:hypothetical protein ILUMI_13818 [Ignelater luminosus]
MPKTRAETLCAIFGAPNELLEMETYQDKTKNLEMEIESVKKGANKYKDELQQYTRLNSLRVFNIPEKPGECTDNVIITLCKEKLGVDISVADIDCSHRLPAREPNLKPIIVRFVSRNVKKLVYSKNKLLKGSHIVIKEDLTKERIQLLKQASVKYGSKTFKDQISNYISRAYQNLRKIFPHRSSLHIETKKRLCEAFVLSQFNYGVPVYRAALDNVTSGRIQKVQNSCLRYVYWIRKYDHVSHNLVDSG